MTRLRTEAAFLNDAADPFAEYNRMAAQFDRGLDQLATDHAAFVKRIDAACERHGVKGAEHLVDLREGVL